MRHRLKRVGSGLLALLLAAQLLPAASAVSSFENYQPGTTLFQGENNIGRQFVSETAYPLAPGVTEYVTYTNEPSGLNQNIDYFCEVDLDKAKVMVGYAGMEGILENHEINWRMQTVSDQVKNAQSYFNRSEDYADATIVAALNADFYNMATGQPTGALIIDGVTYNPTNGRYYFGITKDGEAVISNSSDTANLAYAVGGSNLLLSNGAVQVSPGGRNVTYTAIGIKADGTVVSMVCYGQRYPISCGYTQYEVAQMMKARGCVTALMLDGSGSSTFVSRREGDSQIVTRNNPSDGQERQVSSSIFIVSREQADGVFDHAAISPNNEVYTPGSTVQFTAVGVDRSGGPAPLPADVTWSVDSTYGSITSGGVFTANQTTGDATVTLSSGGQVVGETTITIANPDQITFAEETASIGNGDTSDLGLRVYYQKREVHYKDGDLIWTIEPTQYSRRQWVGPNANDYETVVETVEESPSQMQYLTLGTVSDNQLTCNPVYTGSNLKHSDRVLTDSEKTASAITAKVTVTSVKDQSISGTVVVEACKDPLVAMDFEESGATIFHSRTTAYDGQYNEDGTYTTFTTPMTSSQIAEEGYDYTCVSYGRTTDGRQVGKAEIVKKEDGYPVRFGEQSLRIEYDFTTHNGSGTEGVCFGPIEDVELENMGNPTRIGLWVYIPKGTPNLWLRLHYIDGSGNASYLDFSDNSIYMPNNVARNADDGWHYFECDISNLQTPVTIQAGMFIRVLSATYNTQSEGADKLWASPVSWVKCKTDANGNIILVDKTDSQLTEFSDGYLKDTGESLNIGAAVPDTVTINGETVEIGQVPVPEYLAEFNADRSYKAGTLQPLKGTLYFDNLTFVYGSTPEDTTAPDIESITVKAGGGDAVNLTSGMTLDSGALDIETFFNDSTETNRNNTGVASASLYVDGHLMEGTGIVVNADSLRAGINLANGSHTIRISVVDNYGNEATRTFTVTVDDPEGEGAPVTVTAQEAAAVLGSQIHLDFTPRNNSVDNVTVTLNVPAEYADDYSIAAADGCVVGSQSYQSATETLTFTVIGSVNSGVMATLTLNVPTDIATGTALTIPVNGQAGGQTFNATPVWTVTAPYTVTAGQMVAGMADTCWFRISHTASGEPAQGVGLYAQGESLGVSDENGRVSYTPGTGVTSITVAARDDEGGVSAAYVAPVYWPQGNADGTPTRVWRNAADAADTLNVTWLANPLYAGKSAYIQVAESAAGLESAEPQTADCDLITFASDNAASYVCGAEVTGLTPGRTYYYRVGDGERWSPARSFTTTYDNTGISALVMGDLQESDNTNLSGILEQVGVDGLNLVIQTGDLVDNGSSYSYWNNTMGMLDSLTTDRLFAVGNHEQGTVDPHTVIYNQDDSSYYAIQVGNVFVATIAYNSFSEQVLEQLVADAQASGATWKLLVTHQPPYYTNAVAGMGASTQQAVTDAVQRAGIDVVLSGHDHAYARTEPLWDGAVNEEQGITYFICGSLGEKSYDVTNNPEFHFLQATNNYQALYLTLSTTDSALTIQVYDYNGGNPQMLDSFTKTRDGEGHVHSYVWNGVDRLTCSCGYSVSSATYTGYAAYTTPAGKSGTVYLNAGKLMIDAFAVGADTVHHAGEDGLLHSSETINTAQCWKDGYLSCWCKDCNKIFLFSETRRQGHLYDENHVCTRQVFNMDTLEYETCGLQGKDIATLDVEVAFQYLDYTGKPRLPGVTVTDPETGYELFPQSTYGDYMPYWENNTEVGTATIRIVGYSDGPYYGETSATYQIVPQTVKEEDFTVTTTSNSVHLAWEPAPGATEYIVYQNVNGTWTRLAIVSEPEYTVTGLTQGEYQFRLRPFATVDGTNYYSTRNSDIVTATVEGGGVTFTESGTVVRTYGDGNFVNAAQAEEVTGGFTYSSADPEVATVNASTGEVTIKGAGSTVITAAQGELSGQYRLTVQPKEVSLVWSGTETREYNGEPSQVAATAGGVLEGDEVQVTVSGGSEKDAGTHTAAASALNNSNYALPAENTASYVITPKSLNSLVWRNSTQTYTGQPLAPAASAGADIVAGDTVNFSVPSVTEPGEYRVFAVSDNQNYVVKDPNPCSFTIKMPEVTLTGGEKDELTWRMEGTTIRVSGFAQDKVTVQMTAVDETTSASETVSPGQTDASVQLNGVTYPVDASNLVRKPVNAEVVTGSTQAEIPELSLSETDKQVLEESARDEKNKFTGILASIAKHVEAIVEQALEGLAERPEQVTVEVSESLKVVEYVPNQSYRVDITPVYTVTAGEEGTPIHSGTLTNDQLAEPVQVSLVVPNGIALNDKTTYIRHDRQDGSTEFIRPDISGQVLTFWTDSFSEFEVISDSRAVDVTFTFPDGGRLIQRYTPDKLGDALPHVDAPEGSRFDGWRIGDTVYTEVTDHFLTVLSESGTASAEAAFTETAEPEKPEEPEQPGTSHGGGGGGGSRTYTVRVEESAHGSVRVSPSSAEAGDTVTITVTPDEGYELNELVVLNTGGGKIAVADEGGGAYTFQMPNSRVTVEATFVEAEVIITLPFTDVDADDWFYEAVEYAYGNGLMNGISAEKFAPNVTLTRGMLVTILYRMEGEPMVSGGSTFADVPDNVWYSKAVAWAAANGIVNGTSRTTYEPDTLITREQMATMLYRYAAYKGYDTGTAGDLSGYRDGSDVSGYAEEAMTWCVSEGLVNGVGNNTLLPKGNATRAETAAILMRFLEAYAN